MNMPDQSSVIGPGKGRAMIDCKVEDSGGETTLIINGELTIENAVALQGFFVKALETPLNLRIKLEDVSDVDLSFLQMLCAVHKKSADLNKRLVLTGNVQDVFTNAVKDAGFFRHTGCGVDKNTCCLWIDPERENN